METIEKILTKAEYKMYVHKGISYAQYKENMMADFQSTEDSKIREYINLNQHRMSRVEKTYQTSEVLSQRIRNMRHKIHWLVIAEHWCGDAAQTLPALQKIAADSNGKIELRLVYRDQNAELMDAHLTGQSRSIPKLIQLDEHFNVTATWGPRPTPAQKLVTLLKSTPVTAPGYANELHKWYALDKNHSLETDVMKLVDRANLFCVDCFN